MCEKYLHFRVGRGRLKQELLLQVKNPSKKVKKSSFYERQRRPRQMAGKKISRDHLFVNPEVTRFLKIRGRPFNS